MTYERAVGQVIRRERERQGLSLPELCSRAGWKPSPYTLSKFERAIGSSPKLSSIVNIADALDVPVHNLLRRAHDTVRRTQ